MGFGLAVWLNTRRQLSGSCLSLSTKLNCIFFLRGTLVDPRLEFASVTYLLLHGFLKRINKGL